MAKTYYDFSISHTTRILADTCFWIALGNKKNECRDINDFWNKYANHISQIMIPYPSMPEFMNSKMLKDSSRSHFEALKSILYNNPKVQLLDPSDYTVKWEKASELFWNRVIRGGYSPSSICDIIISEIITEEQRPFIFLTTNSDDFMNAVVNNRNCTMIDFMKKIRIP